ncbi:hypothetical protein [Cysteiniphilum halobium]
MNREKLPKITVYQNLTCWVVTNKVIYLADNGRQCLTKNKA